VFLWVIIGLIIGVAESYIYSGDFTLSDMFLYGFFGVVGFFGVIVHCVGYFIAMVRKIMSRSC